MKNYTEMFLELLDLMQLTLEKVDNGKYKLYDNQLGAYRHDGEIYTSGSDIIDSLDAFIYDYIVRALEDTEKELMNTNYEYKNLEDYCEYLKTTPVYEDAIWDVEVLDMICNHSDEINLNLAFNQQVRRS